VRWNSVDGGHAVNFSAGESYFLPAALSQYEITADHEVEFFAVGIP
jgi:mannose-6-phosphate isomerase class I